MGISMQKIIADYLVSDGFKRYDDCFYKGRIILMFIFDCPNKGHKLIIKHIEIGTVFDGYVDNLEDVQKVFSLIKLDSIIEREFYFDNDSVIIRAYESIAWRNAFIRSGGKPNRIDYFIEEYEKLKGAY